VRAAVGDVLDDGVDAVAGHLSIVLGLDSEESVADRDTLFFSVRGFVEAVASKRPIVLVFEDLHWADVSLLDLVDMLAGRLRDVPILLETHDSHSTARQVAAFCALLDADVPGHNVKAIWDSSHTWSHGETLAESFALLKPWIDVVQFKQADSQHDYRPVAIDAGDFPIQELLQTLDGTDYPLSLEWELKWHPELPSLAETLPAVHTWLSVP